MKRSLRQVLADSHVAPIAIAAFLLIAVDGAFRASWPLLLAVTRYLVRDIASLDNPYAETITPMSRLVLIPSGFYLYAAGVSYGAAWLLSHWVSGVGPFRCLTEHGIRILGRKRA